MQPVRLQAAASLEAGVARRAPDSHIAPTSGSHASETPTDAEEPTCVPAPAVDGSSRGGVLVPILMYHHVAEAPAGSNAIERGLSVSPEAFDLQMAYLFVNGYRAVPLSDVARCLRRGQAVAGKAIVLTFDDGYADNYRNALPVLRKFGLVGTFFVVTGYLDAGTAGYMTWSQVADLAAGGMEIGAHSVDHPSLGGSGLGLQLDQVVTSKLAIESRLSRTVSSFAYPSGKYDGTTIAILREAGYLAGVTTAPGARQSDPFQLRRIRVRGGESIVDFDRSLRSALGG